MPSFVCSPCSTIFPSYTAAYDHVVSCPHHVTALRGHIYPDAVDERITVLTTPTPKEAARLKLCARLAALDSLSPVAPQPSRRRRASSDPPASPRPPPTTGSYTIVSNPPFGVWMLPSLTVSRTTPPTRKSRSRLRLCSPGPTFGSVPSTTAATGSALSRCTLRQRSVHW